MHCFQLPHLESWFSTFTYHSLMRLMTETINSKCLNILFFLSVFFLCSWCVLNLQMTEGIAVEPSWHGRQLPADERNLVAILDGKIARREHSFSTNIGSEVLRPRFVSEHLVRCFDGLCDVVVFRVGVFLFVWTYRVVLLIFRQLYGFCFCFWCKMLFLIFGISSVHCLFFRISCLLYASYVSWRSVCEHYCEREAETKAIRVGNHATVELWFSMPLVVLYRIACFDFFSLRNFFGVHFFLT